MTIIFYDIPSTLPTNAWSSNTWKTRSVARQLPSLFIREPTSACSFCLNFKGVPYRTEWVEYPDIEGLCKKHGIPHTSSKGDGSPYYTLPAIHDPSTGLYISDSFLIAEYLEKTYPDRPSLFPDFTPGFQATFDQLLRTTVLPGLWNFILPATYEKLNPASKESFRRAREVENDGKTFKELMPKGDEAVAQWGSFREGLAEVGVLYESSGGPFLMGQTVSWPDLNIAAWLIWLKIVWGDESVEWKDIASWENGRWKILLDQLKEYQTIL